jgi:hypothetical protein
VDAIKCVLKRFYDLRVGNFTTSTQVTLVAWFKTGIEVTILIITVSILSRIKNTLGGLAHFLLVENIFSQK